MMVAVRSWLPWQWKRCWLPAPPRGCQQRRLSNWSCRHEHQSTVIQCWHSATSVRTSQNDVRVPGIRRSSATLRINQQVSFIRNSRFRTERQPFGMIYIGKHLDFVSFTFCTVV